MMENAERNVRNGYSGVHVICPICNSEFPSFSEFGLVKRSNALCPSCGSLERHRLLWKYFNDKTDLFKNDNETKLLHFAPERVFYDIFSVTPNIEYAPCDLFPEVYDYDGKIKILKVDITNIPFQENYFDVIMCNHVLEHIPDDIAAMQEMYRVMKPGGWGVFQVPIDYNRAVTYEDFTITLPQEREKAFGQHDHVRWYGRDYKDRLKSVGFEVTEDNYVKKFSNEDLFKFGLRSSELIYNCRK